MSLSKAQKQEMLDAAAELIAAANEGGPEATLAPATQTTSRRRKVDDGTPGATYRIEPGNRDGFVNVYFSAKPTETVRKAFRDAHFEFSTVPTPGHPDGEPHWWGKRADLPGRRKQ